MKCKLKNRNIVIEKYLSGTISEKQRGAFDEHCFNCNECFQEVMFREQTENIIETEGYALLADIREKKPAKEKKDSLIPIFGNIFFGKNWQTVVGYAAAAVVLISIGLSVIMGNLQTKGSTIIFDSEVPYEYDNSSLRSASSRYESDHVTEQFVYLFNMSMGAYLSCEYLDAIGMFNQIEHLAINLKNDSKNPQHLKWVRDYYFYRGLTNLSISVSEKYMLGKENKALYLDGAIRDFQNASNLTSIHNLDKQDRGFYFLGFSLKLDNENKAALEVLQKIDPNGQFYEKSQQLIQELSK